MQNSNYTLAQILMGRSGFQRFFSISFILLAIFFIFSAAKAEETESSSSTIFIVEEEPITTSTLSLEEGTASSTVVVASTTAPTVMFNIRYQDDFVFSGFVTSTEPAELLDSQGNSHLVSASSSVLSILVDADRLSDAFLINQLDYYDAYKSFYLNCLILENSSSTNACGNWNYVVDGLYPNLGMDSFALKGGETIYVYFGNPWSLSVSTSTFFANTTTTFFTWRYNYDNLAEELVFDGEDTIDISIPNPNSTGWWDTTLTTSTLITSASGTVDYVFSTTGTYYAKITSPDYSKWSSAITLTVLDLPIETPTSTATSTANNETDNNAGGGSTNALPVSIISQATISEKVQSILNFLKSQQENDGKIIDGGTTDWAIMSFAANNQYAEEIKKGEKSLLDFARGYNFTDASDLNVCASYPRHLLAFLSAGVDKIDNSFRSLIDKIKSEECYKNNQFGQKGINDDVFALLALLASDASVTESIIIDLVDSIIKDQTTEGAFTWAGYPSADITGAAINVLIYARNKGASVEENIFSRAKAYLKSQQLVDGGWGFSTSDALTTSWAVMGINALSEGQTNWATGQNKNPWSVLADQLKSDGFYESVWAPGTTDWFGTKHAVPAFLGKSWPIILPARPQPKAITPAESGQGSGGSILSVSTSTAANSAIITATSSLFSMNTSTPSLVSSTPFVNLEILETSSAVPASSMDAFMERASLSTTNNFVTLKEKRTPRQPEEIKISETSTLTPANFSNDQSEKSLSQAPLEKKVATTTAVGSAVIFASTTLLLFIRLVLTII